MGFQPRKADNGCRMTRRSGALMRVVLALLAVFVFVHPGLAQTEDEVEVTADRFVVNEGDSEATFTGNVVINQPDLMVWADTVIVKYGPGGPSDLQDFEAIGNVRIRQPEQSATGERGTYNPKTKILRLLGNVRVTNDSGTVTGPELIVNIATGNSEFPTQNGGRVTGIFKPSGEDTQ